MVQTKISAGTFNVGQMAHSELAPVDTYNQIVKLILNGPRLGLIALVEDTPRGLMYDNVWSEVASDLVTQAGYKDLVTFAPSDADLNSSRRMTISIVSDYEILDAGFYPLPDPGLVKGDLRSHKRVMLAAICKQSDSEFIAIATHGLPTKSVFYVDPDSPEMQSFWSEMDQILFELVTKISPNTGVRIPLIFLGDFNVQDVLHFLPKSRDYLEYLSNDKPTHNGQRHDGILGTEHFTTLNSNTIATDLSDHDLVTIEAALDARDPKKKPFSGQPRRAALASRTSVVARNSKDVDISSLYDNPKTTLIYLRFASLAVYGNVYALFGFNEPSFMTLFKKADEALKSIGRLASKKKFESALTDVIGHPPDFSQAFARFLRFPAAEAYNMRSTYTSALAELYNLDRDQILGDLIDIDSLLRKGPMENILLTLERLHLQRYGIKGADLSLHEISFATQRSSGSLLARL